MKKTLKKILASTLVVTITLTTILSSLPNNAFAAELESDSQIEALLEQYRNQIPTKEKPEYTENIDTEIDIVLNVSTGEGETKKIETILNQTVINQAEKFSDLTAKQKADLSEYLNTTVKFLQQCENYGYSLDESISIVNTMEDVGLTFDEIKAITKAYGSWQNVDENIVLYDYLKDKNIVSSAKLSEFEAMMLKGYDVIDIYRANTVAEVLGCSIDSIILSSDETESIQSPTLGTISTSTGLITVDEATANKLKKHYSVDPQAVANIAESKGTSVAQVVSQIQPEEKTASVNMRTTSNSTISAPKISTSKEYISAPFPDVGKSEQYVDTLTGALYYTSREVELKGKNGLDLILDLQYTSNDAEIYLDCNEDDIRSSSVNGYDFIGVGWSWKMPQIISNYNHTEKYIKLEDGGTYKLLNAATGSNLDKYYKEDLRLDYGVYSVSNNKTAYYKLTYADGKTQYFDSKGYLCEVQDRFGNKIIYTYEEVYEDFYDEEGLYTAYSYSRLVKITDSLGRDITIEYHEPEVTNFDDIVLVEEMYVVNMYLPDGTRNQYVFEPLTKEGHLGFELYSKNSPKYGEVNFYYSYDEIQIGSVDKFSFDKINYVTNLTKIKYETGATDVYEYQQRKKNYLTYGYTDCFRVLNHERRTRDFGENETITENDVYSETTYGTYQWGSGNYDTYCGYPEDYDINNLPSAHTFTAKVTDAYDTEISRTYNNLHRLSKEVYSGTGYGRQLDYKYDSYGLVYRMFVIIGGSIQREEYAHDSKGNLLTYWDKRDVATGTGLQIDYTYDSRYNLMTSKTYDLGYESDGNKTIQEIYTLSEDGKKVISKQIKESGVVKEKTDYLYDSYGNVTEERRYKDGFTDYVSTFYDYTDNAATTRPAGTDYDGAFLTSKKTTGVVDADGNLVTALSGYDAGTVIERMVYDNYGNVIEHYDGNGNKTTYTYDVRDRVSSITAPDGGKTTLTYNNSSNNITESVLSGGTTTYQYNPFGYLTSIRDVTGNKIIASYTYDELFRITEERNNQENGYLIKYTYDPIDRVTSKESYNSTGETLLSKETAVYQDGTVNVTDENGTTTKFSVVTHTIEGDDNAASIIKKSYTNPYDEVVKTGYVIPSRDEYAEEGETQEVYETYTYYNFGILKSKRSMRFNEQGYIYDYNWKAEIDYANRILREYDHLDNYISYTYNTLGQLVSVRDRESNASATPYSTTYTYDNLGRLLTQTTPMQRTNGQTYSAQKKYYYDKNSNVIKESTSDNVLGSAVSYSTVEYGYDSMNRLNQVKDGEGNYTQYYYNKLGNPLRVYTGLTAPLTITGLDAVTGATGYAVQKYAYDYRGQLTKYTDALNQEESYTYDNNGNMLTKTDRNGASTAYTYDALGRVLTQSITPATGSTASAVSYSYSYAKTGALQSETVDNYTVSYKYDAMGNMIEESEPNIKKTYEYELSGLPRFFRVFVNDVRKYETEYLYNADDTIYRIFDRGGSDDLIDFAVDYVYDKNGRQITANHENGITENTVYNLAGMPVSIENVKGTEILSSESYEYYADGNLYKKTENTGKITQYAYDNAGRLTNESATGITTPVQISYTYDAFSNRSAINYSGAEIYTASYQYDLNNRIGSGIKTTYSDAGKTTVTGQESTAYTYDNNGNTLSSTVTAGESTPQVTQYSYDAGNRVSGMTKDGQSVTYTYRPDGLRNSQTTGTETTRYIWGGDNIVLVTDGNNQLKQKFTYANDLVSIEEKGTSESFGARRFYMKNFHGDVTGITDGTGAVSKIYTYDAFGNEENPSATDTNPFRYASQYWDNAAGTYYLRARSYDAAIGRFTQEDTHWNISNMIYGDKIYQEGEIPTPDIAAIRQSNNLFTYCGGNPVMYMDPSGNEWYHWAIGGVIVAIAAAAVIVTAGGVFPAMVAVGSVTSGVAATSVASTVAAGAFVGSSIAYGTSLLTANYRSIDDFNASAAWGSVMFTAGGLLIGGLNSFTLYRNDKIVIAGKGHSTNARIVARNLNEQLAMKQVLSDPLNGATRIGGITMTDPRWHAKDGWVKMQNIITVSDGTKINIHFVYNTITGVFDDFKFK